MQLTSEFSDQVYQTTKSASKTWNVEYRDVTIFIENKIGSIYVFEGEEHSVAVKAKAIATTKESAISASNILNHIIFKFYSTNNEYYISSNSALEGIPGKEYAELSVYIPRRSHLILTAKSGSIFVGRTFVNGRSVDRAVAALSIKANNESLYSLGYNQGNIVVIANSNIHNSISNVPINLQLNAPGTIEIQADDAIVHAISPHGSPPTSWPAEAYESTPEGKIIFRGTLADGNHVFNAAHTLDLNISNRLSLYIVASPGGGGSVLGNCKTWEQNRVFDGKVNKVIFGGKRKSTVNLFTNNGDITIN